MTENKKVHLVYTLNRPIQCALIEAYDAFNIVEYFNKNVLNINKKIYCYLSHDIAFVSDILPCNKIDKPLVVYRFCNVI